MSHGSTARRKGQSVVLGNVFAYLACRSCQPYKASARLQYMQSGSPWWQDGQLRCLWPLKMRTLLIHRNGVVHGSTVWVSRWSSVVEFGCCTCVVSALRKTKCTKRAQGRGTLDGCANRSIDVRAMSRDRGSRFRQWLARPGIYCVSLYEQTRP